MAPSTFHHTLLSNTSRTSIETATILMLTSIGGRAEKVNTVWPHDVSNLTSSGISKMIDRMHALAQTDKSQAWCLVSVDDGSITDNEWPGKAISACSWNIYENEDMKPKSLDALVESVVYGDEWKDEKERAYAKDMYRSFITPRWEVLEKNKGAVVALDKMGTLHEYWKQGAGRLLMEWGMKRADELNAICCVEASPLGKILYEKYGFEFITTYPMTVPSTHGRQPEQGNMFMIRPRKSERKA